jgi:hypothetical protein
MVPGPVGGGALAVGAAVGADVGVAVGSIAARTRGAALATALGTDGSTGMGARGVGGAQAAARTPPRTVSATAAAGILHACGTRAA